MDNTRLRYLLSQYASKMLTAAEQSELSDFLNAADNQTQLELLIEEAWIQSADEEETTFPFPKLEEEPTVKPLYIWRWAAAVLLLVVAGGTWLLTTRDKKGAAATKVPAAALKKDIAPGGNKAMLTLADGNVITLDSTLKGKLAQQGNVNLQASPGLLKYDQGHVPANSGVAYNVLRTPKGGQYRLELPDGSKVWLNAASSLKFPTAFTGKERRVELSGEAYFEVAKNVGQPFYVSVNKANIAVLGTSFNVMAYADEADIRTTLLEGAVKVSQENTSSLLKPGEQSLLAPDGKIKVIEKADIDLAVAWKNGLTSFKSADIKTIMRQVERWYDVEVVYNGTIPARSFTGDIPRDANLSELLRLLEISKIHFKMENHKLIVMP
ncbi:FecR family protein [Chitinophaga sp. 22321]|uniref:FecR family protein n=1 Tax=Chitinophaga hostae TaxID=2831022 RepID=A0ABS5IUW9_9BACT|nr:FecR family protein [Chitinophaga hostae]MBS0026701.1 FecR family protein [Chitinophaga hostae]